MLEAIDDMVYGRVLAGLALAVLAFELIVLLMAAARRRRGGPPLPMKLHAMAGAATLLVPIAVAISVYSARALMLGIYGGGGTDPSERGAALSRGISAQMNAIPFAISTMIWIVGLWAVPMVFALRGPGPNGRSRALPPAALIGFGLVPVVVGAFRWSVTVIKAYASLAGLPPDEKAQVMSRTLDAARGELGLFARASMIAIVILAVAAAALILLRARARAGAAAPDPAPSPARSARPTLIAAAAAIILAALLLVQARPLAAENDTPWPPFVPGARLASAEPPTPDLVGPDEIERAPVVEVHKDRIALDGMAVDDSEKLQDYLRTLRNNFMLLHPGGRFNEMAVIVAERAAPIPRLAGVLWAIRAAGYHKPLFAFTKGEEVMRPALGKMQRVTATGAQVRLIDAATRTDDEDEYEDNDEIPLWKNAPALRPADFPDYDAFARRLVALRRAGQRVIVNVRRPG